MTVSITFEGLRECLEELPPPPTQDDWRIFWVVPRALGIARTSDGSFEIFISGPRLTPRTETVRRHLEHALWDLPDSGDRVEASRVILPAAPHFLAISALIAVELVRAGMGTGRDLHDVFDDVEPIIELALRRGALSGEHIIGLIGELLCLEVMLDAVATRPELRLTILDMWQGHQVGQRDFVIGLAAIEIKTTQQETSSHKVSGLHQVESDGQNSASEARLFLLSVGLAHSENEGQSLPMIVQRLLERLADPAFSGDGFSPLQRRFLDDVARYGSSSSRGYSHETMAGWLVYQERFRSTFSPRLFDLMDHEVRIIRRRDLVGTHVSPDDIQYRIDLPSHVNGMNPAPMWQHAIVSLVREYLGII